MATLYAGADTRIIRYLRTEADERQFPDPPAGTAQTLKFDADTNAALAADLAATLDAYRLSGATLTKNGATQTLVADGEDAQVRALAAQAIADLTTYIGLSSPTAAQRLTFERLVARILRFYLRRQFD